MPTFGSLFAGIGGIDLGLERAGWECRFQVEWDPFCQRVLAKHWPDVPRFGDIHDVHGPMAHADGIGGTGRGERGTVEGCQHCLPRVDLIAGGFPCQPFSTAGKRRGMEDDRWLWPEFARAIRELRPRYVLVENVPGLLVGGGMGAVLGDLAELGYDAEWESIPAAAVGAPHLRYRVWIVAYRAELGRHVADPDDGRPLDAVPAGRDAARNGGADELADADLTGPQGRPVQPERPGKRAAGAGGVADAERGRGDGRAARAGRWDGTPGHAAEARWGGRSAGDEWWSVEPDVGRVAHGVPARVDRLRSLGNAVVPQVVEVIGRALREAYDAA